MCRFKSFVCIATHMLCNCCHYTWKINGSVIFFVRFNTLWPFKRKFDCNSDVCRFFHIYIYKYIHVRTTHHIASDYACTCTFCQSPTYKNHHNSN